MRMDILMIVLSALGVGYLTVGTGAVVKDAVSNHNQKSSPQSSPLASTYLKKFLKTIGIYLLVYASLNIAAILIFVSTGHEETMKAARTTIINYNLLFSLPITWLIMRYMNRHNKQSNKE